MAVYFDDRMTVALYIIIDMTAAPPCKPFLNHLSIKNLPSFPAKNQGSEWWREKSTRHRGFSTSSEEDQSEPCLGETHVRSGGAVSDTGHS